MTESTFIDRSLRLKIMGCVQIIIGLLFSLFIPVLMFSISKQSAISGGTLSIKMLYPALGMFLGLALCFIALGVGSFFARKWARSLTLIVAWFFVIMGVSSLAMIPFQLSHMHEAMGNAGQSGIMSGVFILFLIIFLSIPYLVIPGMFILLYRGSDVQKTCEYRNPKPSWVDGKPLPVLALVILMAVSACMFPFFVFTIEVFPVFGVFVRDKFALSLLVGSLTLVSAYLAKLLYQLQWKGWFGAMLWSIFFLASTIVTFLSADLMEFYKQMGVSDAELAILKGQGMGQMQQMSWFSMLPLVLYVFYTKKYFKR